MATELSIKYIPIRDIILKGNISITADGATGFVLGAGIYYYLDPTPFVDLNLYTVSSRETFDHWMIYTVIAK